MYELLFIFSSSHLRGLTDVKLKREKLAWARLLSRGHNSLDKTDLREFSFTTSPVAGDDLARDSPRRHYFSSIASPWSTAFDSCTRLRAREITVSVLATCAEFALAEPERTRAGEFPAGCDKRSIKRFRRQRPVLAGEYISGATTIDRPVVGSSVQFTVITNTRTHIHVHVHLRTLTINRRSLWMCGECSCDHWIRGIYKQTEQRRPSVSVSAGICMHPGMH